MTPNTAASDADSAGREMYELATRLYPIHRCITGDGLRRSLKLLREFVPLEIHEVPTGTPVFDWEVPKEWNIRDAYVEDDTGTRVIDYRQSNLHVVNYSLPVNDTMSWHELRTNVHTLPAHPDWIPYRTAYFREQWGFCTTQRQYDQLEREPHRSYRVCIDASLQQGSLTYGELHVPGESDDEVLIACHICHPSLANDNLSGMAVATQLARHLLSQTALRYNYRLIFVPATIGAIAWLSINQSRLDLIKHGLVLSLLGDPGRTTYKSSRQGDAEVDRIVAQVLRDGGNEHEIRPFEPFGYDERQFCSPGINLPMGCLMRTPNGEYPEYHTSADDLDLLCPRALSDSWAKCVAIVSALETNRRFVNLCPYGEPQLGRRGLYTAFGERNDQPLFQRAMLWVLNLSDGEHSLLDIAERSEVCFSLIAEAAEILIQHKLLAPLAARQVVTRISEATHQLVPSLLTPDTHGAVV